MIINKSVFQNISNFYQKLLQIIFRFDICNSNNRIIKRRQSDDIQSLNQSGLAQSLIFTYLFVVFF